MVHRDFLSVLQSSVKFLWVERTHRNVFLATQRPQSQARDCGGRMGVPNIFWTKHHQMLQINSKSATLHCPCLPVAVEKSTCSIFICNICSYVCRLWSGLFNCMPTLWVSLNVGGYGASIHWGAWCEYLDLGVNCCWQLYNSPPHSRQECPFIAPSPSSTRGLNRHVRVSGGAVVY